MREVSIIGVGAHPTGRFVEKPLKAIAYSAIWDALNDAGAAPAELQAAYVGNSLGGLLTGQEGVRGLSRSSLEVHQQYRDQIWPAARPSSMTV
jgi:acetyl-CoA acyltransferase